MPSSLRLKQVLFFLLLIISPTYPLPLCLFCVGLSSRHTASSVKLGSGKKEKNKCPRLASFSSCSPPSKHQFLLLPLPAYKQSEENINTPVCFGFNPRPHPKDFPLTSPYIPEKLFKHTLFLFLQRKVIWRFLWNVDESSFSSLCPEKTHLSHPCGFCLVFPDEVEHWGGEGSCIFWKIAVENFSSWRLRSTIIYMLMKPEMTFSPVWSDLKLCDFSLVCHFTPCVFLIVVSYKNSFTEG